MVGSPALDVDLQRRADGVDGGEAVRAGLQRALGRGVQVVAPIEGQLGQHGQIGTLAHRAAPAATMVSLVYATHSMASTTPVAATGRGDGLGLGARVADAGDQNARMALSSLGNS